MRTAVALLFVIAFACAFAAEQAQFAQWKAKHSKVYATAEEEALRFENFKVSVQRINRLNLGSKATFALNKFSDLTPAEFRAKYLMQTPLEPVVSKENVLQPTVQNVPPTYDWRPKGVVTAVKDQGQCGSCWAFSTTENIESVWMLAHGLKNDTMKSLAPQQIVDCDTTDEGCNGGFPASAYDYVQKAGGLETEADYPYHAVDQQCHFSASNVYAKISNFKYATSRGDETTLQQNLVSTAPLSICLDASNWQDYQNGVMSAWGCCWLRICQLDHCVQLVGYDTTASTPYYIVRNSWGTDWGENGFIRLEIGTNTCGITNYATTSIV